MADQVTQAGHAGNMIATGICGRLNETCVTVTAFGLVCPCPGVLGRFSYYN